MLDFYLIRHGQTQSNIWKTFQGWSDTSLTELGIQQGKDVALRLKNENIIGLFSSTSERAYDIAYFINAYHELPINMTKGLKEMNFGLLETHREIMSRWQDLLMLDWTKFEGENLEHLQNRMRKTMDAIADSYQNKSGVVVCVTHSFSILSFIRSIDKEVFQLCLDQDVKINNCSVNKFQWNEGQWSIKTINEVESDGYLSNVKLKK